MCWRELYERSIYERSFTSEPSIEKYQAKPAHVNTTVYLDVTENPVEYQKLLWNVSEEGKETTGICLWAYSSKVRRVSKNVCKLHSKRVILNKAAQHEKKYFLNCSMRINQRIIKLKYRASRYLSMFLVINPCVFISVRHTHQTIVNFNWVQIERETLILLQCALTLAKQ